MPIKRRYGDELTGGTNDVNPQSFTLAIAPNAPVLQAGVTSTTAQQSFPVPIPRFPTVNGRSIVFELLDVEWVDVDLPVPSVAAAAGAGLFTYEAILSTNPVMPINPLVACKDPRTIAHYRTEFAAFGAAAAASAYTYVQNFNATDTESDLTDKAGHGYLIATDNIYLYAYTYQLNIAGVASFGLGPEIVARLAYRMKEVSLAEYVGIVQSQQ